MSSVVWLEAAWLLRKAVIDQGQRLSKVVDVSSSLRGIITSAS